MLARTTGGGSDVARPITFPTPAGPAEQVPAVGPALVARLLEDVPFGVLLIDPLQRPVFANAAARAILEKGDGIGLVGSVLRENGGRSLEPRLQRILRGWCGAEDEQPVPFYVARPSGRRPYEVTVCLCGQPESLAPYPTGRHAIVYLRDPDAGVPIDEQALRQRYGLTPAEARTAAALALGGTLPEHSELRKLRPMTLRGYVKQIFARTGTHSQLDLVRLVLTGVAAIASAARERDDGSGCEPPGR